MIKYAYNTMNHIRKHFNLLKNSRSIHIKRTIQYLFKENLFLMNVLTSGGFMGIGDLVQQKFERRNMKDPSLDWPRAARMFAIGSVLGSGHHYYYIYLDKLLPQVTLRTVFMKIAGDQFVCAPLTIVTFFYGMGVLEQKTVDQSTQELQDKFIYVYSGDWLFWPPVQFLNFYYLPTRYRVVCINFATMIFDVFLSYCKHDLE